MWAYDLAPLSTVLLSDIANTRTPYWLRSGDKTQMGIPIEARAPFLDYRVVDLAFRLPPSYLVRDGWHKWILRRAFADLLPPAVLWRRVKVGFPFPLERFFAESAAEVAAIIERCTSPFVAPPPPGDPVVLWRLLSFLLWHQLFVRRDESVFDDIEALVVRRGVTEDGGFQPEFLRPREAAHGRP
jgi:asparagine synthase (glutamine-hydrolysing)